MLRANLMSCLIALSTCFVVVANTNLANAQDITEEITGASQKDIRHITDLSLDEIITKLEETWKEYAKQLQAVVKARLLEEREFVAQVALLVQQKKLPKSLVDSSWLWVRSNRPYTNSPFVYFERVLRLQATKAGFRVPPFDARIYSLSRAERLRKQQERQQRR